jgi:hypothetical protein
MIGQYLSNTNEKATVSILQNILELNKALAGKVISLRHFVKQVMGISNATSGSSRGLILFVYSRSTTYHAHRLSSAFACTCSSLLTLYELAEWK